MTPKVAESETRFTWQATLSRKVIGLGWLFRFPAMSRNVAPIFNRDKWTFYLTKSKDYITDRLVRICRIFGTTKATEITKKEARPEEIRLGTRRKWEIADGGRVNKEA